MTINLNSMYFKMLVHVHALIILMLKQGLKSGSKSKLKMKEKEVLK